MMTIAEAANLISACKLSPVEITQELLRRIERFDGSLRAFITLTGEQALAAAKRAEASILADGPKGPLHGIPIAHKDIFCTQGIRTTAGSRVLADYMPDKDAWAVRRFAEAGAIMLGKLAMTEFAWGGYSTDLPWLPTRNPWDLDRSTGGSSSGTASAIAAGLILGGTGTDTGGSIRLPAAYCGITGFKPTYGLCPRTGVLPLSRSLDHVGPMAWTVEDCAILLQAMAGHDPDDPDSVNVPLPDFRAASASPIAGVRIGLVRHFHETDSPSTDAVHCSLEGVAEVFRALGAHIRDVILPPLADWTASGMLILLAEAYAIHGARLKSDPHRYGEWFRDRALLGAFVGEANYRDALLMRRELSASFLRTTQDVDLLICAIVPGAAPPVASLRKMAPFERPSYAFPFNVAGAPALALRAGFIETGLPLGVQIAGRPFADALVLRAGHYYEQATNWSERRPPMTF